MDFMLGFRIETRQQASERVLDIRNLVIAGWTGRDKEKMEHHMAELEALGNRPDRRRPWPCLRTSRNLRVRAGTCWRV